MNLLALLAIARRSAQPEWLLLWLLFGLALAALIAWAAARERRKRREGLAQFALETGLVFSEQPDDVTSGELAQIQIKSAGFPQHARSRNVLRGTSSGLDTIIADRTVGSGKNQTTSTIVAFQFSTPFPSFMLCAENVLWHIAEKFGYSDIDIEGAPDFSRRFFLHGDDPAAIRALFKPEVTQAFEQIDNSRMPHVTASGQWLVTYYPGRTIAPAQLRDFLQQAQRLADAFRSAQKSSAFR